eukprot:6918807-Prymnesium_polylepis.1
MLDTFGKSSAKMDDANPAFAPPSRTARTRWTREIGSERTRPRYSYLACWCARRSVEARRHHHRPSTGLKQCKRSTGAAEALTHLGGVGSAYRDCDGAHCGIHNQYL